jgi:hypothetical protein
MKCSSISLLCGLLLVTAGIFAFAPGPVMAQVDKKESNKKIVVIFKGGSKDPATKLSLDEKDQGSLAPETYLELSVSGGSHTITAGEETSRKVRCSRSLGGTGQLGTSSTSFDHIEMTFNPASLKVDLSKSETIYLLLERFKPPTISCEELESHPENLSDYRLREIKEQDGVKLVNKYKK